MSKLHNINPLLPIRLVLVLLVFIGVLPIHAARIKDIADVQGVTGIQVIGYGLVVGLNNTGDNQLNEFTNQSVRNMLQRFGLTTNGRNNRMQNTAAVMITATLPSFAKRGSKIDVTVSSIGDATSLQGGNLLMTPLSLADGTIVGNAQGPLSVGGYDFRALGTQVSRNFVTTGRVPQGLVLQSDISGQLVENNKVRITLHNPDFTSVTRMSEAINGLNGLNNSATAIDAATVEVELDGTDRNALMAAISNIENVNIQIDPEARVVINERTGTVVVGGNVELLPAVIAHGGIEITIQRQLIVPQPAPFTILPPRIGEIADINVEEDSTQARPIAIEQPTTVENIAGALNLLQVKPRDLIAIFQALKESGSLQAELIIQ
ncbi:MAG: flagellar basal body P-ring protein FlgI [Candidatus Kapaibacteriales bacterium]